MSEKPCPQCTFLNTPERSICEICGSPLAPTHKQTGESGPIPTSGAAGTANRLSHDLIRQMIAQAQAPPPPPPVETPIQKNKKDAYETIPESFIGVEMLYVPVQVNDVETVALIDTGAQVTLMSLSFAQKCGLEHLIDESFGGVARGVGERKIHGRIWMADIQLGVHSIPCSFTILEGVHFDMIIGLNMMKTHNCAINFHKRCLEIGGSEIQFVQGNVFEENSKTDDTQPKK